MVRQWALGIGGGEPIRCARVDQIRSLKLLHQFPLREPLENKHETVLGRHYGYPCRIISQGAVFARETPDLYTIFDGRAQAHLLSAVCRCCDS